MIQDKKTFRETVAILRNTITREQKLNDEEKIIKRTVHLPQIVSAHTICVYVSLPEEVDTHRIIQTLLRQEKSVIVPRIQPNNHITLHHIHSWNNLTPRKYFILEPDEASPMVESSIVDCFIVPGLAFDRMGNRLGWGKGYYDRLLADITVPRIALAFSCQILPHIPHESYDILMTDIVTETEVIEVR